LNLKGIMAGGRIPNYSRYADELSPREFIAKVKQKEIYDPTLSFQLSNDFISTRTGALSSQPSYLVKTSLV